MSAAQTTPAPCYVWNDERGNVFCGLCAWTDRARTIEQIEAKLQGHLQGAHGVRALARYDDETGRRVEVPA